MRKNTVSGISSNEPKSTKNFDGPTTEITKQTQKDKLKTVHEIQDLVFKTPIFKDEKGYSKAYEQDLIN
jgi:hypothetical protein